MKSQVASPVKLVAGSYPGLAYPLHIIVEVESGDTQLISANQVTHGNQVTHNLSLDITGTR